MFQGMSWFLMLTYFFFFYFMQLSILSIERKPRSCFRFLLRNRFRFILHLSIEDLWMVMEMKEKFECPHCKKKLPFFFVTKIKADHAFDCLYCGEKIIPERSKSFTWGFVIGFLSFVIPAQTLLYLNHNFLVSFLVALLFGLVSVFFVASYVYTTTHLIKSN